MKKEDKKPGVMWKELLALQITVFVYSVLSMCSKLVSVMVRDYGLFSLRSLGAGCLFMGSMALYAFFWQQILRKVDLHVAYAHKAAGLFWSLLWSVLLFREEVSLRSIIGLAVVCAGLVLVSFGRERT